MPTPSKRFAQRVVLYFWPRVDSDKLVLDVWEQIPQGERPQEVFRKALLLGLREMAANGELPEKVLRHNGIGERLARRLLPAAFIAPAPQQAPQPAYPGYAQPHPAAPAFEPRSLPPPGPAFEPAAMDFEAADDEEPDIDAMLELMAGGAPMTRQDA